MENSKFLEILIIEASQEGNIGVLLIDGKTFCWTISRDFTDKVYAIPEGLYPYERYMSPTYGETFQIIVESHTALLFHFGNFEENSSGCLILGEKPGELDGKRAVLNSRKTFEAFMYKMRNIESGWLRIKRW